MEVGMGFDKRGVWWNIGFCSFVEGWGNSFPYKISIYIEYN
jgi:hypothetical protein